MALAPAPALVALQSQVISMQQSCGLTCRIMVAVPGSAADIDYTSVQLALCHYHGLIHLMTAPSAEVLLWDCNCVHSHIHLIIACYSSTMVYYMVI